MPANASFKLLLMLRAPCCNRLRLLLILLQQAIAIALCYCCAILLPEALLRSRLLLLLILLPEAQARAAMLRAQCPSMPSYMFPHAVQQATANAAQQATPAMFCTNACYRLLLL